MSNAPHQFRQFAPLLVFTTCALFSVGIALAVAIVTISGSQWPDRRIAVLAALILIAVGGAASFMHLGRKARAWRAFIGLPHSWLSREALLAMVYGGAVSAAAAAEFIGRSSLADILLVGALIPGGALAFAISMLYKLEAQIAWQRWYDVAPVFTLTAAFGCALAIMISGDAALFMLLIAVLVIDAVPAAARLAGWRRFGSSAARPLFPAYEPIAAMVPLVRLIMLGATGLILFANRNPVPPLIIIGMMLVIDRVNLYAGARQHSPGGEIAKLKAERMRAAAMALPDGAE